MRIAPALPLFGIDVAILAGGFGTRLRGVVDAVAEAALASSWQAVSFLSARYALSSRCALCHALQWLHGRFYSAKNRLRVDEIAIDQIAAIAPETASAEGSSLPLEKHGVDARWRALAEKHLR